MNYKTKKSFVELLLRMDFALLERESNRQFFSPLSVLSITNEKSYPVSSLVEEMMLVLQLYSDSFNINYQ